jgi:hypothetical protein
MCRYTFRFSWPICPRCGRLKHVFKKRLISRRGVLAVYIKKTLPNNHACEVETVLVPLLLLQKSVGCLPTTVYMPLKEYKVLSREEISSYEWEKELKELVNVSGAQESISRNRFQGIDSASLCSLAGRCDNPVCRTPATRLHIVWRNRFLGSLYV